MYVKIGWKIKCRCGVVSYKSCSRKFRFSDRHDYAFARNLNFCSWILPDKKKMNPQFLKKCVRQEKNPDRLKARGVSKRSPFLRRYHSDQCDKSQGATLFTAYDDLIWFTEWWTSVQTECSINLVGIIMCFFVLRLPPAMPIASTIKYIDILIRSIIDALTRMTLIDWLP